jgi:hypothetical protein
MKANASVVQRRQMETGEKVGTNLISAAIDAVESVERRSAAIALLGRVSLL